MSYGELRDVARDVARGMVSLDLERCARIGLLAETGPDFLISFYACQYAGLVPCPLPLTLYLGGRDAYVAQLAKMAWMAKLALMISPRDFLGCAREAGLRVGLEALPYDDLFNLAPGPEPQKLAVREPAFIQYSSGSTSDPKGVVVTQEAVCANVRTILRDGLKVGPDDHTFSWLPLYHDMGLVGFSLAPMFAQIDADYTSPHTFARRPALWLKLMSANRSTITFAPSFGYRLAAERFKGDASVLDMSHLRVAGVGGDMVRAEVLDVFAARFEAAGFRRSSFLPSYGLAEAVLAVTFSDLGAEPVTDGPSNLGQLYVSCGRPLPEVEIAIVDNAGRKVADAITGNIRVRGPNVMTEYFDNPLATDNAIGQDGFLETGDIGYLVDGWLFVTGRNTDVISCRGRNIWPQDVEWAAEHVEPLRPRDVAAIGVENGVEEELVLLVQCGLRDGAERAILTKRVGVAVRKAVGVAGRIVLVPPRSLPFTSSGKLARARARDFYLSGRFWSAERQNSELEVRG
ncbi:AMP-binding protein [Mesorhizobium xinjiangense]|uniref:AMP-binding protein n=1 Tax=Mesorhizobium xinjiangense TaxID=2678685 RepID=UPI0018DC59F6|nr:AMP-binding protein [Mesorhizobium xinjiangense]